ncbi:HAMP domain-containing sensor histidine kinase [uncultured Rikenella sp.]|uniref:sensor histidine kinase n=1 Tax=uncultured Rikenella sp. TaxID=368003 RepID=UPI0025F750BB|nr:HAMP domain-containing sensor histidine kinase [uncultured Rikenella sp.]
MASGSNRPTFHRRLFLWLLVYSWLMVLCFAAFQYHRERRFKAGELDGRLQTLNEALLGALDRGEAPEGIDTLAASVEGLRVSVIDLRGHVLYDNTLDSLPGQNHLERPEIAAALRDGSGYTLRRHSESTGETYFYSARRGRDRIVRTAVPYSVSLRVLLRADYGFLWFMIGVTSVMSLVGYFATRRVGLHVSRLNRFARQAERGERIFDTEPFPKDELGEISSHIVRLYARLQQALADRDRQHRLALHAEQEKIRIKKQLTNNISHELKTPVAAMQVCLETLMTHRNLAPEKRDEFLARCYAQSERLKNLLADVSLITRMDDGGEAMAKTAVDLREIVVEVCDEFEPAARRQGVVIEHDLSAPLPVAGHAALLASVFRNLIANALAYSGGRRIEIRLLASDSETVSLSFSDDGCGVGDEHLPHLFERFYRVDKGRSRQAGGTGLGLSIVRNAVLWHGGDISVANRPGGGLIFHLTLKRK